jgi:hypothetical protein
MHNTQLKRLAQLFAATAALMAAHSAQAFCGFYAGKADSSLFNEASQVVVVRDGQRTVLSMLNDYKGDLREFALVVPTPVTLQKGQVRIAERASFDRLDAYSSPRLAEYHDNDPCQFNLNWGYDFRRDHLRMHMAPPAPAAAPAKASAERAKALGVTVEVQYTLGEYDIVSLSAKQSDGLETWLRENGYRIPQGASAALKPYINQGMKFFVAKVNLQEQAKTGYSMLRPLQFAFESEKFMLPMRLGMLNAPPGKAQDLIIYMLTKNGRVESSNYRTVKLPANMNLPFFVKPKFQDFYKAMFDAEAKKENHKVVFTEYFWDMNWCDPCAANPLSAQELRNTGVFWVGGDENENFQQMKGMVGINTGTPAINSGVPAVAPTVARRMPPVMQSEAQPVVLTRLHVRYTPESFAEDLMFTQTKDRQNWQTRYVIQNPYAGSVAQCSSKMAGMECEAVCKPRVSNLWNGQPKISSNAGRSYSTQYDVQVIGGGSPYSGQSEAELLGSCIKACQASKQEGLLTAQRYYEQDLPRRLAQEKQTLARLTGWSMAEIDRMPQAQRFAASSGNAGGDVQPVATPQSPEVSAPTWWQKLFGKS